jgi:hypothetical protein
MSAGLSERKFKTSYWDAGHAIGFIPTKLFTPFSPTWWNDMTMCVDFLHISNGLGRFNP